MFWVFVCVCWERVSGSPDWPQTCLCKNNTGPLFLFPSPPLWAFTTGLVLNSCVSLAPTSTKPSRWSLLATLLFYRFTKQQVVNSYMLFSLFLPLTGYSFVLKHSQAINTSFHLHCYMLLWLTSSPWDLYSGTTAKAQVFKKVSFGLYPRICREKC